MANINTYTPDGVQDILYESCRVKKDIEGKLRTLFRSFAYKEIETPALEFLEVFSAGGRAFPPESMFKVFDEKGRVLVLKPDQTIPAARVAASKLRNIEDISKISYITNTYRFTETGAGRQREYTQAGCELINASGPYADSEIMALAINSMIVSEIEKFQIDIGQVDFFKGLMEESGLDDKDMEVIRILIDKKDYVGLEEVLREMDIKTDLKDLILSLPSFFGDIEIIDDLKKIVRNEKARSALENIEQIYGILKGYGLDRFVSIDLGMVQSINYYTGLIFKGYTHSIGYPVLYGGRYDRLLDDFGMQMPAVGFSVGVNMLVMAVARQGRDLAGNRTDTFLSYEGSRGAEAYKVANILRRQGLCVEFELSPGCIDDAVRYSAAGKIPGLIFIYGDGKVKVIDNDTGEIKETTLDDLYRGGL